MSKNIVVFSDGTGQEGGVGANTNIYKLFNMVEDRTQRQISYYDRGLGTGWRKVSGNISGAGISKNILECYQFIFDHYEAGDQIYLIGFSRGAATVRSLSNFIHHFGILPKARPELIKQAFKIYKIRNLFRRDKKAKAFIAKHRTMWTRIKFLGCFDSVAALGVPSKTVNVVLDKLSYFQHKFHDFRLSPSVENGFHALAIDDERKVFHPMLWDEETLDYQKIEQVWFCGAHTDVGGGYNVANLSDISLQWMRDRAVEHGMIIYPRHRVDTQPEVNGKIHNPREGIWQYIYQPKIRFWPPERTDKPVLHPSVLERKLGPDNTDQTDYQPWIKELEYEVYGQSSDEAPLDILAG